MMVEVIAVLCALLIVGLIGVLTTMMTAPLMTELGFWVLLLGLLTGIPTGVWYHWLLYRILMPRGALPPGWWLAPGKCHPQLDTSEIARIKPWYTIGGLGFLLSLAGGVGAMAGLLLRP